jgi:hypothetical protein
MRKRELGCAWTWLAIFLAALAVAWSWRVSAAVASTGAVRSGWQDPGASPDRSVLDGVFTVSQASRGEERFQKSCKSCHTVGEHTGRKFGVKYGGTTVGDLVILLTNTMPQEDPGSLPRADYVDILAFFLKESGYPEGQAELPTDLPELNRIRVERLPE